MTDLWDKRLRRAEVLEERWPFAREILRFFRAVTAFQKDVYLRLIESGVSDSASCLAPFVPAFLELVARRGPLDLARMARERRKVILTHEDGFFSKALLQPFATASRGSRREVKGRCPFCGRLPIVGVLREDKEASAVVRALVCSLCSAEWSFPRVLCPSCDEERPEKLPRYNAEEIPWVRIEACDSCRRYLKAVDLTKDFEAEPVVDEAASVPLDVIARDRGYTKLETNIVGI